MFTKVMSDRLAELVKDNKHELFPNSRTINAAATQTRAWEKITKILNKEFPNNIHTVKQIEIKWKNLKQDAKEKTVKSKK